MQRALALSITCGVFLVFTLFHFHSEYTFEGETMTEGVAKGGEIAHPSNNRTQDNVHEWVSEGGEFAEFFNNRTTGRGIHKWVQYFPAYNRHFKRFIGKEVHIVEIGIQSGGSLDMWKAVFGPHARVYGVDINANTTRYKDDRTHIYIGSQSEASFWTTFKAEVPRVDILIDDGGHTVNQMVVTLTEMLPHLSSNGVYMTEDIHQEGNGFWTNIPYHLLNEHAKSLLIYPYLFVVEKDGSLDDVARDLGTVSKILSSSSQLPFPETSALPGICSPALRDDAIPTISCLAAAAPLSALTYGFKKQGMASSKALLTSGSFQSFHHGTCCNPDPSDLQKLIDSVHVYPEIRVFKRTRSEKTRFITAPRHGTQWIPYS